MTNITNHKEYCSPSPLVPRAQSRGTGRESTTKKYLPMKRLTILLVAAMLPSYPLIEAKIRKVLCQKEATSNKRFFRAHGIGKGMTLQIAMDKARLQAKSVMATQINTVIKKVTDNYTVERSVTNAAEYAEKFESMVREVVNQKLKNIVTVCEEQIVNKDGSYSAFVAIEMDRDELLDELNYDIAANSSLREQYDADLYKKIYLKEMDNMGD